MARLQRTLARAVTLEGVGLHTGEKSRVVFRPAAPEPESKIH